MINVTGESEGRREGSRGQYLHHEFSITDYTSGLMNQNTGRSVHSTRLPNTLIIEMYYVSSQPDITSQRRRLSRVLGLDLD